MKGIDVAIADPIELVNELDTRPSVKEIIQKHQKKIDEVKAEPLQGSAVRSKQA